MVYFVGAGPGDPELITVKGKKKIEEADIIIYAGSLVNKALLNYSKAECRIYNSAEMTLKEILTVIKTGALNNLAIVRLHTGDPSIYGALREQIDALEQENIPYEIIPGVSSFCGAAAVLKKEYTLPGVTQTIILTRMEGRTEVPEKEKIEKLALHKAAMVVFLSTHMMDELAEKLKSGYEGSTPAAVVYKATWPQQKIIQGTIDNIADLVKKEKVSKTALLLVGDFLGGKYELSRLYDENFSHEFRSASE